MYDEKKSFLVASLKNIEGIVHPGGSKRRGGAENA
jgi:hypothetical protein